MNLIPCEVLITCDMERLAYSMYIAHKANKCLSKVGIVSHSPKCCSISMHDNWLTFEHTLNNLEAALVTMKINDIDGVKIDFESTRSWVHLRRSNTEPIIRIYSEAPTQEAAEKLAEEVIGIANRIINV